MFMINLGAIALAISGVVVFFAQVIRSLWGVNINDATLSNKTWMRIVRIVVAVLSGLAIHFGVVSSSIVLFGAGIATLPQLLIILAVSIFIGYFGKAAETLFVQIGKVTISAKLTDSVSEVVARKE